MDLEVCKVSKTSDAGARACLGRDSGGQIWGWVDEGSLVHVGSRCSVGRLDATPVPEGISLENAIELVPFLRARRLIEACNIGMGSSVLVGCEEWPAREILTLCRLSGVRWRAVDTAAGIEAEYRAPFLDTEKLLKMLPNRPDVVVCSAAGASMAAAFRICRDWGFVAVLGQGRDPFDLDLYPDVHSRGLRVKLNTTSLGDENGWKLLDQLRQRGLIGGGRHPPPRR